MCDGGARRFHCVHLFVAACFIAGRHLRPACAMPGDVLSEMDVAGYVPDTVLPGRSRYAVSAPPSGNDAYLLWRELGVIPERDVVDVVGRASRLDHMHVDVLGNIPTRVAAGPNGVEGVSPGPIHWAQRTGGDDRP